VEAVNVVGFQQLADVFLDAPDDAEFKVGGDVLTPTENRARNAN
jgi:hypothetical protein